MSVLIGSNLFTRLRCAAHLCYPGTNLRRFRRRAKMISRGLLTAPWTAAWLRYLQSHALTQTYLVLRPKLVEKLHRPYLRGRYGVAARLRCLVDHFDFIAQAVPPAINESIGRTERVELSRLQGRDDKFYTLGLTYSRYNKEGNLSVDLSIDADQCLLASMTFAFVREADGVRLSIGGQQGANKETGPEPIKEATKALQHLRPKYAVLLAVSALAEALGIKECVAVSDANHVQRVWWRKPKEYAASYDEFWLEQGGVKDSDGDYRMPAVREMRPVESLPSNKRAEYRRRLALMQQIRDDIQQLFLAGTPVVRADAAPMPEPDEG